MSAQQTKSVAFGVAAALLLLTSIDVAVAASKFGVGAPKLHRSAIIQTREIQAAATGDGPATERDCKKYEAGINSWGQAEVDATEAGDERGARNAKRYTEGLINEATDNGCFIIY